MFVVIQVSFVVSVFTFLLGKPPCSVASDGILSFISYSTWWVLMGFQLAPGVWKVQSQKSILVPRLYRLSQLTRQGYLMLT